MQLTLHHSDPTCPALNPIRRNPLEGNKQESPYMYSVRALIKQAIAPTTAMRDVNF